MKFRIYLNQKVFYTEEEFQAAKLEIKQEYEEKLQGLQNRENQLKIKEEEFMKKAADTIKNLKTKNAEIIEGEFLKYMYL